MPFRHDDFNEVYEEYFADLIAQHAIRADLSGWRDTRSDATELLPDVTVVKSKLDRYYLDEGDALGGLKTDIVRLIAAWEDRPVDNDEITLSPSVSTANFQVLAALKRRGVRAIFFETPGYAVTMNQAAYAGLEVVAIPTFRREAFTCHVPYDLAQRQRPWAIWLTQPRMSLGFDQSPEAIAEMARLIGQQNYLVVDEATEQRFPAHLRMLRPAKYPNVIRTRGITKGLGLNGLRIACAIHPANFRAEMESTQEVTGVSLDYYSLAVAARLADDLPRFRRMLTAANTQTTALQRRVKLLVRGSPLSPSDLVNGYIGSLFLQVPGDAERDSLRSRLLQHCRRERTFVILGNSMRFAFDASHEFIRVNYFNREHHVIEGVESILRFAEALV